MIINTGNNNSKKLPKKAFFNTVKENGIRVFEWSRITPITIIDSVSNIPGKIAPLNTSKISMVMMLVTPKIIIAILGGKSIPREPEAVISDSDSSFE